MSQVKVRFYTNDAETALQVSDTPVYVPVLLKRYGLLEVVNHLLALESTVPFDFLIDGEMVRGLLNDYLTKHGLSSEAFLKVEYARAVLPPSFLASFSNEDWVLSVDAVARAGDVQPQIVLGAYDGVVRTYDMLGKVTQQYVGHSAPVKAVRWVSPSRVISGGMDRTVRLWRTNAEAEDTVDGTTVAILEGHTAAVVALATTGSRILSALHDHTVGVWSTLHKEMQAVDVAHDAEYTEGVNLAAAKKRRRLAVQDASVRRRAPLAFLEGHSAPVEDVVFDPHDSSVAYSVSQDHSIKTWDLVTSRCVDLRQTGFLLLSTCVLGNRAIACGLLARHITLHDPRAGGSVTHDQLHGHRGFVVLVAALEKEHMMVLGSHDGTVRVWDVRADKALHTITRESGSGKVFGVGFEKEIGIVSGGEDKQVQINKEVE